jgi:hypothetical protein
MRRRGLERPPGYPGTRPSILYPRVSDPSMRPYRPNVRVSGRNIQPDLTTCGKLAFELPPSKVNGSTLVLEDLYGSGEIKVDLGL